MGSLSAFPPAPATATTGLSLSDPVTPDEIKPAPTGANYGRLVPWHF